MDKKPKKEKLITIIIQREYQYKYRNTFCTIGTLTIGNLKLYTIEPPKRQNRSHDDWKKAGRIKAGTYWISEIRKDKTKDRDLGWRLQLAVKDKSNIQIHRGNYPNNTIGCILPGLKRGMNCYDKKTKTKWATCVSNSREAMNKIKTITGPTLKGVKIKVIIRNPPVFKSGPQNSRYLGNRNTNEIHVLSKKTKSFRTGSQS